MKRLFPLLSILFASAHLAHAQTATPTPTPKVLSVPVKFRVAPASNGVPTLAPGTIYFATTGSGSSLTVAEWIGTSAGNKLIFTGVPGPQGLQGIAGPQGATGPIGATGNTGAQGPIGLTGATGPQGPQGAKGDTGAAGAVGATGLTGAQGVAGAAATIAIGTVTAGTAGTNATVTNAGTNAAAVFNFTIPQGATGATGAQGLQGIPGVVAATVPLVYTAGTQTVSITPATTTSAGSLSAADQTKLNTLLAPLTTSYTFNPGALTLGLATYTDVPLTGATVNMTAEVNPPSTVAGSLSAWRAAIITANSVRVYYTTSVAIAAGNQTWIVKAIRNVGD